MSTANQKALISALFAGMVVSGNNWLDAWAYKWLEAAAAIYQVTQDEALDRQMDEIIDLIAKAQQSDGYIATQVSAFPGRERWTEPRHHELYTMGHLLTAACLHHRITGKTVLLDVACRTGCR